MKTSKFILIITLLFTSISCLKVKQRKKTIINISVLSPITQQASPIAEGIPFKLFEITYDRSDKEKKREIVCEGKTDSEGKAIIEFNRVNNYKKWRYEFLMEFNVKGFKNSQYGGYGNANSYKKNVAQEKVNNIVCYLGEEIDFIKHIKNTNCFDANDKAEFLFEESVYLGYQYGLKYTPFVYDGCYDLIKNVSTLSEDYYPYTLTVTRNGQTTVTKDTFKIEQGMDTLKWFY